MTVYSFLLAAFIAANFVVWPVVSNFSQAGGGWTSVIVGAATAVVLGLCSARELLSAPLPTGRAILMLAAAGIMNGVGVYLYSQRVSDSTSSPAVFIVTVSVLMIAWTPILDRLILENTITARQMLGLGLAAASIYLIRL